MQAEKQQIAVVKNFTVFQLQLFLSEMHELGSTSDPVVWAFQRGAGWVSVPCAFAFCRQAQ